MIDITMYSAAGTPEGALTNVSVWRTCGPDLRAVLELTASATTNRAAAEERVAAMLADPDCCPAEVRHTCDRCHDWDPKVWEVTIKVAPAG